MISHTARAILVLLLVSLATAPVSGDGAFVWNKGADIQEPSQKAIIYYAAGREDLLLQVRYQGPATKFGWMVPVPGKPEVAKASIESFYELSRVVQSREGRRADSKTEGVEVLQRHTVGAYDVATLKASDADALNAWLKRNDFQWPSTERGTKVLRHYVDAGWYFVAVKVELEQAGDADVQKRLNSGELHPLRISFDAPQCVYPLKISSLNRGPTEVHVYVLADGPFVCDRMDFITSQAPSWGHSEIRTQFAPSSSRALLGDLPRLAAWTNQMHRERSASTSDESGAEPAEPRWLHLVKHVKSFTADEMEDLTFRLTPVDAWAQPAEQYMARWFRTHGGKPEDAAAAREFRGRLLLAARFAPTAFVKTALPLVESGAPHIKVTLRSVDWEHFKGDAGPLAEAMTRQLLAARAPWDQQPWEECLKRMPAKARDPAVRILTERITDPEQISMNHGHYEVLARLMRKCEDEQGLGQLIAVYDKVCRDATAAAAKGGFRWVHEEQVLCRALGSTGSTKAADALVRWMERKPAATAKALLEIGDARAADALAMAAIRGEASKTYFEPLLRLDRKRAAKCLVDCLDADRPLDDYVVTQFAQIELTDEAERALAARVMKLPRNSHSNGLLRRCARRIHADAKSRGDDELDAALRALVAIRGRILYRPENEPIDDLVLDLALRRYGADPR